MVVMMRRKCEEKLDLFASNLHILLLANSIYGFFVLEGEKPKA